jgi:hypothetical protein
MEEGDSMVKDSGCTSCCCWLESKNPDAEESDHHKDGLAHSRNAGSPILCSEAPTSVLQVHPSLTHHIFFSFFPVEGAK